MNDILNIEAKITDINRTFQVKIDTGKNTVLIFTKPEDPEYDYHLTTESTMLSDLVDELKDVEVEGRIIDGNKALELARNERFEEVIKAIIRSIGKRNLFLTVTSLFGKFRNRLKIDLSINKLIKLIMSETIDIDKWEIKFI